VIEGSDEGWCNLESSQQKTSGGLVIEGSDGGW